jgi:hypothetical protein
MIMVLIGVILLETDVVLKIFFIQLFVEVKLDIHIVI